MTFSQIGGAPFALTSIDYAKWQGAALAAGTTTVTGHRARRTTVATTLSPGGIFGGPGADIQTFAFGPNWANLVSVVLVGTGATSGSLNYFAIDKIVVEAAPAPKPATPTLLGLGSAYLIGRRRGREGLVDLTSVSWNQMDRWLRQIASLRSAA